MGTRRRRVSVIYFISKLVKWDDLRMEIISNPTQIDIEKAAKALINGHLVAFPTETVYGLGADATNEKAVSRIYSVKDRPLDHPLIVHVSSINKLEDWATDIPDYAIKLAREFWPGPLTVILKRSKLAKNYITGNQEYVALRVPGHPVALELIRNFESLGGLGIVAPSANRFGAVSPTSAGDVTEELGAHLASKDLIIDGGNCEVGIESTIIDCTGLHPRIIRPGFITTQQIENTIGRNLHALNEQYDMKSSGQSVSHYSPRAEIIESSEVLSGEGFIAMDIFPTPLGAIRLASPKTNEEYAKILYKAFRAADSQGLAKVKIIPPAGNGLAASIADRINKASTKSLK